MTLPLDEILGPPSFRERIMTATIVAHATYDYGDDPDDVEHEHRVDEAEHVLARIAPALIEHGRLAAAREIIPDSEIKDWDALTGIVRYRDGWRVDFEDGEALWTYRHPDRTDDAYLAVMVGGFGDFGDHPYLVTFSEHEGGETMGFDELAAGLPKFEEVARVAELSRD